MTTNEVQGQKVALTKNLAKKLAVVLLDFRQWTGASVLREEDFRLGVGGELPPENVIRDWGSKCICNPDSLKIFAAIKRRAERLLSAHGVAFMGGTAIPMEKSQAVLEKLSAIADDYNQAREAFLADYDRQMASWLAENSEFSEQLAKALLTRDEVRQRIHAKFHVFKVSPLSEGKTLANFEEAEAGLGQTLLEDIAKEAQTLYLRSMLGKSNLVARNLEHFRKWRERLMGLRFLDNRLQSLIDEIDKFLLGLPVTGRLEGTDFYKACAMTLALADAKRTEMMKDVLAEKPSEEVNGLNDNLKLSFETPFELASDTEETTLQEPVSTVEEVVQKPDELVSLEAELAAFEAFEATLVKEKLPESDVQVTVESPLEVAVETVTVPRTSSISECASFSYW